MQVELLFIVTRDDVFVLCNVTEIDMWAVSGRLVPYRVATASCIVKLALIPKITQPMPELLSL
jgi:TRAP-type C4-dicarboxylate transport system permease large subunit